MNRTYFVSEKTQCKLSKLTDDGFWITSESVSFFVKDSIVEILKWKKSQKNIIPVLTMRRNIDILGKEGLFNTEKIVVWIEKDSIQKY